MIQPASFIIPTRTKTKQDSLKVIKTNGKWLVDFKYIFHKTDSLP